MPRFARESRTSRPMPVTKTASEGSAAGPCPSLRFDFAYPILKQPYDRVQWFQFGGGTRF